MAGPTPLVFESILKEKVWGGRRLAGLGKVLRPGVHYGESWELADLASTSVSGGGGGAAVSIVREGAHRGKSIGELIASWGTELLGEKGLERAHEMGEQTGAGRAIFPLLLKYLDAREHLSVQVHPSPDYARAHAGAHLKTESWYIVATEAGELPGGKRVEPLIFKGLKPGVTRQGFREDIAAGTVAADLFSEIATAGFCHTLPSGTVHALGAGVLVAEVQTPSDTTFRVYDWTREYARAERGLHIDQALACIDFEHPEAPAAVDARGGGLAAETDFYTIRAVHEGFDFEPGLAAAVMVLAGDGVVAGRGGEVEARAGTTVLIPAAVADGCVLDGSGLRSLVIALG
jgi:mannose-6-phosphate isomerase